MPTSVAHIVAGYSALEAGTKRSGRPGIFFLFLIVVVANLPDLDFLPGVIVGDVGRYHRGPSHSLFAAAIVAAVAGWAFGSRWGGARRVAGWTFVAYGSHLLLDMLIPDPSGGTGGIALLWPILSTELGAPIPGLRVLDDLRSLTSIEMQDGFFHALLSLSGVRIFLLDAVLVLPLVPLAWGIRARRVGASRRRAASNSSLPLRPKRRRVEVSARRRRRRVLVATEGRAGGG